MTYNIVSEFSATWGVVYFFLMFAVVLIYALNPKAKDEFDHAANIPLREESSDE